MKRRMLLELAALPCCMAVPGWAQDNRTLQISTLLEQDPATSIAEQVVTEAYRRLGLRVHVQRLPGERSLRSANNGDTDGELYRKLGMEREYPHLVIVPVALLTYEIVIFTLGTSFPVHGWDSLRPFTIGFVKSIKIVEQNTLGMRVEVAATLRQAFLKMLAGRSDVVVANKASGLAVLKELNQTDIKMLSPPLATFPVFHYLNRKHAALVPRLTAVLQQMQKDRTIENIQKAVLLEPEGADRRSGDGGLAVAVPVDWRA